ncbi:hypothetical protein DL95DRAFT_393760 [Leptodontidium sp. 2 PMI_412]|nr:hypothetical protein DL95DRAFT_393760 [Leptodontidium sp. 2 PMI_412]
MSCPLLSSFFGADWAVNVYLVLVLVLVLLVCICSVQARRGGGGGRRGTISDGRLTDCSSVVACEAVRNGRR